MADHEALHRRERQWSEIDDAYDFIPNINAAARQAENSSRVRNGNAAD
jgi:hypothetical protein